MAGTNIVELTIQRRMDAFTSEYDEKQKLKEKGKDEQIARMAKTINDLQYQRCLTLTKIAV